MAGSACGAMRIEANNRNDEAGVGWDVDAKEIMVTATVCREDSFLTCWQFGENDSWEDWMPFQMEWVLEKNIYFYLQL